MEDNRQSPRRLRVLIVAPSFDILGGQSVQAARLLDQLREEPSLHAGFLPINPRLPGVLRQLQRIKYVRTIVTSIAYVASLLWRVHRYDVIHVFSASYFSFVLAPTPAILIGKLYRRRVLLNYHSGEAEDHLQRWRRSALPTIKLADVVIVPSEYLVRVFDRFGIEARAIYNLIDTGKFRFRERVPPRPIFLSNRNLESHYGVDRVLRAFALIQQKIPEASLNIVGDGSQRRSLERLAGELDLRNTTFQGQVAPASIADVYDAADIYLNGSEIDNQPLSLLEAFACGLPVVTTDAGGIPDIVSDGNTGMVVRRGDYAAMAERAMRLLNDPPLTKQLIEQGRRECLKYSWQAVREDWLSTYQQLLSSAETKAGKLQKLRHSSFDELKVRGSQALAALAERRGWSRRARLMPDRALLELLATRHGSPLELRDRFRERSEPKFFPAFDDPSVTTNEFRRRWPLLVEETIARADRLRAGHFDLLGFRQLNFGNPIDWHLDPVAGKRSPLVHWSRLNYLEAQLFGDHKIVWELNRHQYFATLGQAYWLTADERYAETFVAHVEGWMDQNPPKLGINWASSLEVAFRSISWLWALHYFKHSPALTPEIFLRVVKFLYLNALHLETYLSTYFSPNTHLTGEALGLFYLGTLLPEFKEASRWRKTGASILLGQLDRHVQPDGVYFEQTSYYHRYTTDFYLHFHLLARDASDGAPPGQTLEALIDHLMYIQRPDGRTPLFGDDDGGRLLKLDNRAANDFRATLSTGAAVFERGDYKFVAGGAAEETLWLLGAEGLAQLDRVLAIEPEKRSIGFEQSGYYVMRDGWRPDSNYLFFDCGHHGAGNCGHAHADALSFELSVKGHSFLIDPGTYTYTASKELRDTFRSSAAHNTLTIDGESWSIPGGPFSWKTIANCGRLCWLSKERFDYLAAFQERLDHPATELLHQREVFFLKNNYWVIRDRVETFAAHEIETWFHFAASVEPLRGNNAAIRLLAEAKPRVVLQVATFAEHGAWRQESGWVSHCYGMKEKAPVFAFSFQSDGPEEAVTFLVPESVGAGSGPVVRQCEALNGSAFAIDFDGRQDMLLLAAHRGGVEHGRIQTARFASDFDLAWIRFANEQSRSPEELVLIGGRTVELDGRVLLKSTKSIDYLVASSMGDRFRVETNEGELELSLPVMDLESLFADLHEQSAT